ncbi:glycosyltransferase family 39 protein [Candidatus Micrarchaeota archaeon]|nr:glycosyltransferase family 39 protein [Candidatus Micrarchaeota archaeon]
MVTTHKPSLPVLAVLVVLIASAAIVRFDAVLAYDKPLKFDSYFHARVAAIYNPLPPTEIPWPEGGRPNFYPPVYHYVLLFSSAIFGDALQASRFVLPFAGVLTVLAVFLLVRRFKGDDAALIAALFAAISPHAIAGSYDSPQGIGLLLSIPAFYLLYKGKALLSGIMLAVIFLTDPFPAAYFAVAATVTVLWTMKKARGKSLLLLLAPPALAMAGWFASHSNAFSCMTNSIGTYFLGLVGFIWMDQESPIIFIAVAVGLYFLYRERRSIGFFEKFWLAWVLMGAVLYFSYPLSSYFHPWRQNAFLLFGFYIMLPGVLLNIRWKLLRALFLLTFLALAASSSLVVTLSGSLSPPLDPNDYVAMDWLARDTSRQLLAHPDFCAGYQTLKNKSCLMDIYLECIPDKQKWFDLENVYYSGSREPIISALDKYGIRRLVYQDKLPFPPDAAGFDKVYTAWSLPRYTPESVYER